MINVPATHYKLYEYVTAQKKVAVNYDALFDAVGLDAGFDSPRSMTMAFGALKRQGIFTRYEKQGVKYFEVASGVKVGCEELFKGLPESDDNTDGTDEPHLSGEGVPGIQLDDCAFIFNSQQTPGAITSDTIASEAQHAEHNVDDALKQLAATLEADRAFFVDHVALKRKVLRTLALILDPSIGEVLTDIDAVMARIEAIQVNR